MIRQSGIVLLSLATLGLTGCIAPPSSSSPNVQRDVAARSGLKVGWPETTKGTAALEEAVSALLKEELTAESAAAIALLNSRKLRATFEEIGISQAELIAARRLPNPTFFASVRWPDARPRTPNVEFNLGMDVLTAFLLPLRAKFAGEQLAEVERQVAHEALSLVADAKVAAYAVQARQEFRARLLGIVEVNDATADLAQRQYDAGNISRLELLHQQSALQTARLELSRTEAELRRDREKLNRLLSLWGAQTHWQMSSELPPAPEREAPLDQVESLAVSQRLDLAAAQSRAKLAHASLELKRGTRLLPVSINVGVNTEREPGGTGSHTHVTGPNVELALPIFDQGQADIARLAAESRRADANFEALAIDIRSEVREARDALLAGRTAAEYHDNVLLPQRRAILRETLLHYNAMQKSNYELLLAKQQTLEAERARIEAWRDYWIARADLERAVGGRLSVETAPQPTKP